MGAVGGTPAGDDAIDAAAAALRSRSGRVVVIAGRGNLAERADATVGALAHLAEIDEAGFLVALRRSNVRGALDLGLAPGFLPGRVSLEAGRDWFEELWGAVPSETGLDALGILEAAAAQRIGALILLGADPLGDCPDTDLATRGLAGAGFTIAVDTFITDSNRAANVFLPVTTWGEQDGTVTNLEGRVQRVTRKVTPEGTAMPDWRIAVELALRLREDFDLATAEEVQDEIARVAPAFAGVDAALLRRARDGAVLPIAEHDHELVLGRLSMPLTAASWEPIAPGADLEPAETVVTAGGSEPAGSEGAPVADDESAGDPADETASEGTVPDESTAVSGGLELPTLHVWDRNAPTPSRPGHDAYALRLVSSRVLYDDGVMAAATPAFASLVRPVELRLNATDRDRIGVADGARVRVTSSRGQLDLAVRADTGVTAGTAVLAWNLPGTGASTLIDAAAPVTDLRVESIR